MSKNAAALSSFKDTFWNQDNGDVDLAYDGKEAALNSKEESLLLLLLASSPSRMFIGINQYPHHAGNGILDFDYFFRSPQLCLFSW